MSASSSSPDFSFTPRQEEYRQRLRELALRELLPGYQERDGEARFPKEQIQRIIRFGDEFWHGHEGERDLISVGITAEETVKIFKPQPGWPKVKRTGSAGLIGRHIVVLTEKCGVETIAGENSRDSGRAFRDDAVIARKTGGHVGDGAVTHHVVVAPGQHGRAGG